MKVGSIDFWMAIGVALYFVKEKKQIKQFR
jgi:hypothetical protein